MRRRLRWVLKFIYGALSAPDQRQSSAFGALIAVVWLYRRFRHFPDGPASANKKHLIARALCARGENFQLANMQLLGSSLNK
jgi:hypothetical protein